MTTNHINRNNDSSFLEINMPAELIAGSIGGPEYSTEISTSSGGLEYRNINWSQQRMRFTLSPRIMSDSEIQQLTEFFHICRGKASGFRFNDWRDNAAKNQKLRKLCNNRYQLIKRYSLDEETFYERIIKKPISNTLLLMHNEEIIDPQLYTIDYTNGIVETLQDYTEPLFANYEFDVPVRFDNDSLQSSIEGQGMHKCQEITLLEIKL